jgi:rubrerythrin
LISKHPLELPAGRKLSREEIADALRLSIIAELDAINLYTQLARAIDDEAVRKVLLDVAREEKTHVGEFLALLKKIDPEQVKELSAGEEEVKELTERGPSSTSQEAPKDPASLAIQRVREVVEESRRLRGVVKPVKAPGLEGILGEAPSGGRSLLEGVYEISESFSIPSRLLRYWASTGVEPTCPSFTRLPARSPRGRMPS